MRRSRASKLGATNGPSADAAVPSVRVRHAATAVAPAAVEAIAASATRSGSSDRAGGSGTIILGGGQGPCRESGHEWRQEEQRVEVSGQGK